MLINTWSLHKNKHIKHLNVVSADKLSVSKLQYITARAGLEKTMLQMYTHKHKDHKHIHTSCETLKHTIMNKLPISAGTLYQEKKLQTDVCNHFTLHGKSQII